MIMIIIMISILIIIILLLLLLLLLLIMLIAAIAAKYQQMTIAPQLNYPFPRDNNISPSQGSTDTIPNSIIIIAGEEARRAFKAAQGKCVYENRVYIYNDRNRYLMLYISRVLLTCMPINRSRVNAYIELCHLYPYPCPKKFYKLPAVLFCYITLFYNWLGHGHGYKWHSSMMISLSLVRVILL